MTEIPEHLLKRSQAAKAKSAGAEPPADASAAAPAATPSAVPAVAATPAPARPAAAPAPAPDSPVVAAYKARKKIPVWAMLTLSILPVWAFMYWKALSPQKAEAVGPLAAGAASYSICASCHGGGGEGGAGRPLSNGEVVKTFPHIEDQLRFVYLGSNAYKTAGIASYGDPNRAGGAHAPLSYNGSPMPSAGAAGLGLSDVDILNVVCHERYTLDGLEQGAEFDMWCSPTSEIHAALASGSSTLANLSDTFKDIIPIGDVPVAGSPAAG